MRGPIALVLAATAALGLAQVTPNEKALLANSLFLGNLELRDLNYSRIVFPDLASMPLVKLGLEQPIEASNALMAIHAKGGTGGIASLLRRAETDVLQDPVRALPAAPADPPDGEIGLFPAPVRTPILRLARAINRCNERVRAATAKLTAEERRELIESLPLLATEEPSIKFSFTTRRSVQRDRVIGLLRRVDLVEIRRAAEALAVDVEEVIPDLREAARQDLKFTAKGKCGGIVVEASGTGDDRHDASDAMLTLDLGGNDTYTGRVGTGVGYTGVLVDISGDDTYRMPDLSLGAGILGVGLAYDLGGANDFRGKSLTQGCGLAGVGVLMVQGDANDHYEATSLAQGYGEWGIGILLDTEGNDDYNVAFQGQGAARTDGLGWLIDRAGDDVYKSGGLILNSPLFADYHYSNAQGYASGYREDDGGVGGGVGLLTDLGGDDHYLAETYAQAASYWYSVGSLYDAAGNDVYSGAHYVQASAMHATSTYLFDLSGNDTFTTKVGACQAIGHDYGVAFLLDRKGNDLYMSQDGRPGIGTANGLGVFLDAQGDDRYLGFGGVGNPSRGTSSFGVFADSGGSDRFADTFLDRFGMVTGSVGMAWHGGPAAAVEDGKEPPAPLPTPTPGSLVAPSESEMARIYAAASQWRVGTAVTQVDSALNQLIAIGAPAVRWMIDHRLAGADRLQLRAFYAVVRAVGPAAKSQIVDAVASPDPKVAINALKICSELAITEAGPAIPGCLKRPELKGFAIRAAGPTQAREAINDLLLLCGSDNRIDAVAALVSLNSIPGEEGIPTAQALLSSDEAPMRRAAALYLARRPDALLKLAPTLLQSSDERVARGGVQALSLAGTPATLGVIAGLFNGEKRPGMLVEAMVALNGRVPEEIRYLVGNLRNHPDPRVATVAARLDFGR
ncbi:MAG: hypothetical protein JST35_04900 [Armatimonadetes bacterium]|nr:hypothetical protein [Armatimonadota bacterium]